MAEGEIKHNALVHRDVSFTKQTVETGQDTPVSPDGTSTTFSAVAGGYMISASNEAAAKGLADMVLDQKVDRAALPDGAILSLWLRLGELVQSMAGGMAPPGEDFPQTASLDLGAAGGRLKLNVKVGF
jgi:hypothetical protein